MHGGSGSGGGRSGSGGGGGGGGGGRGRVGRRASAAAVDIATSTRPPARALSSRRASTDFAMSSSSKQRNAREEPEFEVGVSTVMLHSQVKLGNFNILLYSVSLNMK